MVLANDCRVILDYTKHVLCCDIHTRTRSKRLLKKAGAELVLGLDELMTTPVDGSGDVYKRQFLDRFFISDTTSCNCKRGVMFLSCKKLNAFAYSFKSWIFPYRLCDAEDFA